MASLLLNKIKFAFKQNIKPAIYLQLIAFGLGLSYFYLPVAKPYFEALANLKNNYGVLYAVVSTSLFGGLLPYLLMLLLKQITFKPLAQLVFYCMLWAFMGWMIDRFYTFQGVLFGEGNDIGTIAKKVLFDQFVFTVFIASPFLTVCLLFKEKHFKVREWLRSVDRTIITEQLPATLISTWIVWIPAVSVIYAMPSDLQIPLFNIVLCMFVLILVLVNTSHEGPEQSPTQI
ncbi:hypothetical protein ACFO4O_15955 [Glaciecola siphonariae]|uniref:Uncharacterized protein n=1 Tax=Glaciecola siphonariae TaxID=521012 RepID=A0ABV9M153_9ALTE